MATPPIPEDPSDGVVYADDEGSLWRWENGGWAYVQPLRRVWKDITVLRRDYVGRYVTVNHPERGARSAFADDFLSVEGATCMVHDGDQVIPIDGATSVAHDPHGRTAWLVSYGDLNRHVGVVKVVAQLEAAAMSARRRVEDRQSPPDVVDHERDRLLAVELALEYQADLAAGRVPPVTATSLGTDTGS